MRVDLTPEVLCERIEQQLASDGNFAGTIANSALYMNCGRTPDAFADVAELIEPIVREAVREQTEWLMEEVCLHCGRKKLDHPLPDFDDGSCPCNKTGWYSVDLVTRAEYLRQRGEKP